MRGRSRTRTRPPLQSQRQVIGSPLPSPTPSRSASREPLYRTTSLETRSRSPSPNPTPVPTPMHEYYGSVNLTDRSRSPSPSQAVRRPGRRLPATPNKPSTLNLNAPPRRRDNLPHVLPSPTIPQPHKSPGSINFPRLNASPTHLPRQNIPPPPRKVAQVTPSPGGRPRPYSPTEKNNLNLLNNQQQSGGPRLAHAHRTSSRDSLPPDLGHDRERGRDPRFREHDHRYSSQILNNGQREPRYNERDNRFIEREREREQREQQRLRDRENIFDAGTNLGGRGSRQIPPNLPNGYKPGQGQRGERMEFRGGNTGQVQSDSDDEDWC